MTWRFLLGGLWTSPNTLLGLLAGGIGLTRGARARWRPRELALVFARMPWPGSGALTLGNVILHTGDSLDVACATYAHRAGHVAEPWVSLADHERAHVYQYMALGPLFLPLYLLCGGVSVHNPFERAADRYARCGTGWWPFARSAPAPTHATKESPMTDKLDLEDLDHLARVAEGQGATVPEAAVARLMLAGLVRRPGHLCEGAPSLELTPAGLARVRSSDQ